MQQSRTKLKVLYSALILYDFDAENDTEVSVKKGVTVDILNDEDPDWLLIRTSENKKGYLPKSYAAPMKSSSNPGETGGLLGGVLGNIGASTASAGGANATSGLLQANQSMSNLKKQEQSQSAMSLLVSAGSSSSLLSSASLDKDVAASRVQQAAPAKGKDGYLILYLKHCRNLRAADITGTSDPYVVIRAERSQGGAVDEFKSDIIKKTLNPTWNQVFGIDIDAKSTARVELIVWDWDQFTQHDLLGKCSFSVRLLTDFEETELSLSLDTRGQIALTATYVPNDVYGILLRKCIENGKPYTDVDFKADADSIGTSTFRARFGKAKPKWQRFSVTCEMKNLDPQLFLAGIEPADIKQQRIGDCYFLGALAVVASQPKLIKKLFVPHQYSKHGMYQIKLFWKNKWQEILIDDQLPMIRMDDPFFARSISLNEGWVSFLEKAYAKLHGSYQAIEGAHSVREAFEHITGGFGETISLADVQTEEQQNALFDRMLQWRGCRFLMAASTAADDGLDFMPGEPNDLGIVPKHAYSVLDVRKIDNLRLIKARNTWGNTEWKGDYADESPLWTDDLKKKMHWRKADDGVFHMTFGDFLKNFRYLYLCKLAPEEYTVTKVEGDWDEAKNLSGGMIKQPQFCMNPQYALSVAKDAPIDKIRVLIAIERTDSTTDSIDNPIGTYLFQRNGPNGNKRMVQLPKTGVEGLLVAQSSLDTHLRDAMLVTIDKNAKNPYTLIPVQWYPKRQGSYRVTVYSEHPIILKPLEEDNEFKSIEVKGAYDGASQYGPCTQVTTWLSNPMYKIDIGSNAQDIDLTLTVKQDNKEVPFFPFILKASGQEKISKKKLINARDCSLFNTGNVYHQQYGQWELQLRKDDAANNGSQFILILATPYPRMKGDYTLIFRTNATITVTNHKL